MPQILKKMRPESAWGQELLQRVRIRPVTRGTYFIREKFFTPYLLRKRRFEPKIRIFTEKNRYIIKTAETEKEFRDVLHLRFNVFYGEYLKRKHLKGFDIDKFDFLGDHLMVVDKEKGRCVGTYRLISSVFSEKFYSETEFDIDNIKRLPGNLLELGRSCVEREARNGFVLTFLWKGLSEYIKKSGADYLFGCTSVKTTDFYQAALMYRYLRKNYYASPTLRVKPRNRYPIKNFYHYISSSREKEEGCSEKALKKMFPSLLLSYLNAGAMICGQPAFDEHFCCVDFFTLLDMQNSSLSIKKKFALP